MFGHSVRMDLPSTSTSGLMLAFAQVSRPRMPPRVILTLFKDLQSLAMMIDQSSGYYAVCCPSTSSRYIMTELAHDYWLQLEAKPSEVRV